MKEEPLFRIYDKKYKKWAFLRGENGRTSDQYWREKFFKNSGLIWCDLEGFSIDENGNPILNDECGNSLYLPADRFQVCFSKEKMSQMVDSPTGNYKLFPPTDKEVV